MNRFTNTASYYAPLKGKVVKGSTTREIKITEIATVDHLRSMELMVLAATQPHKRTTSQRASRKHQSTDLVFAQATIGVQGPNMGAQAPSCSSYDEHNFEVQAFSEAIVPSEDPHGFEEFRKQVNKQDFLRRLFNIMYPPYVPKSLTGKYVQLDPKSDELVNALEALVLFFWQFARARSLSDRLAAVAAFAKMMNEKLDTQVISVAVLMSALDYFVPAPPTEKWETQGWEETFDTLQGFLDKYDLIKTAPVFTKLYKFGCFALALSIFKPLGIDMDFMRFDKVAQEALRKQYHMGPDFIHSMLDTALFLARRGHQCYVTGSVMPIFHSEERYQQWYDKAERLQRQANFLSNPEPHGIDRFAYLADLKEVIEVGRSMKKCATKKDEKLIIGRMLSSLELTHDLEVTKRSAQKDRKTPLCMLLFGGSGIGKSTLQNIIFQHYGKVRKLNTRPEFRYVRNPTEEFWSCMNSTQWCIIMDDIAFQAAQLGVMDPSLAELLCVANNVPFVPAQADLADKGRTPVRAELVIGSTNTEHLNLSAYFSCPLAVQRRFPWVIDVKVKPEYQSADRPGMLDSSRVPVTPEGEYPDLWHFTIKRVEPAGEERNHQRGRTVVDAEFTTMREFIAWFNGVIENHNTIQDKILAGNDRTHATKVCERCSNPVNWCTCLATQSLEDEEPDLFGEREASFLTQRAAYLDTLAQEQPATHLRAETHSTRWAAAWYYFLYRWVYSTWLDVIVAFFFGPMWFWSMIAHSPHRWQLARVALRASGARARHRMAVGKSAAVMAMTATAVVGLMALYKVHKNTFRSLVVQGNTGGRPPVPDANPTPRPSYQDPYPFSNTDLSASTLCSKGNDGVTLKENIRRALCVFTTRHEGKTRVVTALNIRGAVYVCNAHGVPPKTPFMLDVVTQKRTGISTNVTGIKVTETMVDYWGEQDLIFIRLDCLPPGTNLADWMPAPAYTGRLDGVYMGRSRDGTLWEKPVRNLHPAVETWKSHDETVTANMWAGTVDEPTELGDCGSVLLSHTPAGWAILGLHTLGRGSQVRAVALDCSVDARTRSLQLHEVSRGRVEVSAPSVQRNLTDLAAQSVTRDCPGVANVIGSFAGEFRQRSRSNVAPTLLAGALSAKLGFEQTRTRPNMGRLPWSLALKDMVRPVLGLDSDILDCALDDFKRGTRVADYSAVHVYDLHTAINGCPGLEYCDKLNRKSSAGAPYKRSKTNYMYFIDPEASTDMWVDKEIEDTVESMIATYVKGERVHAIFCGHLKDEPVTFAKAEAGKTRVFTAAGMAHTLVTRMYLLPVIVFIQKRRYTFETGVGVVAQSLEWQEMYQYLTHYGGERMVAGDYAKFDKRMPASVILATFDIMLDICERGGYSSDELAVVRGIAYDTAFPTVDFNGDLIEFFGSNPSGHALTVIVNSLANSLYMRYTFLSLRPPHCLRDFKHVVRLMTYGDDNAMGVRDGYEWFNHTAIQGVLAEVGIEYTMADKEAQSIPYISIADVSFLKRTWRWDPQLRAHVAPLAEDSIAKMLMVCVQKKNISPTCHALQIIATAVREYFFYGQEKFTEMSEVFKEIVHEEGLDVYVETTTFPTWGELVLDFEERSKHVSCKRTLK